MQPPLNAASSQIGDRIERLPVSRWHIKVIGLVGAATFFDAFDALAIAMVLPVLVGLWSLTPPQVGLLISMGYVGQLIGAVVLGLVAERYGRIRGLAIAVALISGLSAACAFAWNAPSLMVLRLIQGVGLGGEVPIAATYVNELCPARRRGALVLMFQTLFAAGVAATAFIATMIIPHFGWRWMFALGAFPALLLPFWARTLPESPRWLAGVGRTAEADQTMSRIEDQIAKGKPLPPVVPTATRPASTSGRATIASLFSDGFSKRTLTVWAILFCTSMVGYGLLTWLPTIYRTVYHLSPAEAVKLSLVSTLASPLGSLLGAAVIDRLGRKLCFTVAFVGAAVPLLILWKVAGHVSPVEVMWLAAVASLFIAVLLAGIYVYAPEVYPTRMRAMGAGVATAWYRLGAIVSPTAAGFILAGAGVGAVFLSFAVAAIVGALVVIFFAIETSGRSLEEITV